MHCLDNWKRAPTQEAWSMARISAWSKLCFQLVTKVVILSTEACLRPPSSHCAANVGSLSRPLVKGLLPTLTGWGDQGLLGRVGGVAIDLAILQASHHGALSMQT